MFKKPFKYTLLLIACSFIASSFVACANKETQAKQEVVCANYDYINITSADFKGASILDSDELDQSLKLALNNICMKTGNFNVSGEMIKDVISDNAKYNLDLSVSISQAQYKEQTLLKDKSKDTLDIVSKAALTPIHSKTIFNSTQKTTFTKSSKKVLDIGEDSDIDKKELQEMLINTISKSIQNTINSANTPK